MGLFDKIFDDILGFDPPKQVSGQVSSLTPNQSGIEQALSSLVLGQTGGSAIGQPGRTFPGAFTEGPTSLQQSVFNQAPQLGQQVGANLQGIANPQSGNDIISQILAGGQGFLDNKLEGVANRFGALDATSSSASRDAITDALQEFTLASQAQALPFGLQQNQQQIGANMALLDLQNFLSGVGREERGIKSEQLLGERQKFELQDPLKSSQIQLALGLLGGQFAEPFTTTKTPLATQLLGSLVGGAGQGAGAFAGQAGASAIAAALSDERLKDNIEVQGEMDGMRVTTWTWNAEAGEKYGLYGQGFGLIAQDVEERHPDCVVKVNDHLAIDYGRLIPQLEAA